MVGALWVGGRMVEAQRQMLLLMSLETLNSLLPTSANATESVISSDEVNDAGRPLTILPLSLWESHAPLWPKYFSATDE